MEGWTKVDPKLHAEAMKIIAQGRREGESSWDLIDRANAVVGILPRRRRKAVLASIPVAGE